MLHLRLIVDVSYDVPKEINEEAALQDMKLQLEAAADHLANEGLLTDDHSEIVVDTWTSRVVERPERCSQCGAIQ